METDNYKVGVIEVIGGELDLLRKRIIENHERAGQVASGRTRASLRVELTEDGGILWGRKAFGVLETGRRAGKVPKNFSQIIMQWAEDKGIRPKNPKSFAFLVARKIAREGTRLYRQGGGENIYSPEAQETIDNIMKKVLGIMDAEVEHINLNFKEDEGSSI